MADARNRGPDSIAYRWMSAGIGAILVACAALIVWLVPFSDWLAMIAAGVLFALGIDATCCRENGPMVSVVENWTAAVIAKSLLAHRRRRPNPAVNRTALGAASPASAAGYLSR